MNTRLQTQVELSKPTTSFTSAPTGLLQRKCARGESSGLDGECIEYRNKRLTLQRRSVNQANPSEVPPIVSQVLRSPGQPLDQTTRAFMESRFGHDLSKVRVHTDTKAVESARTVNALAYTVGQEMVFDGGQYKPGTSEGRKLIAHELTHVIQQSDASRIIQKQISIGSENISAEEAADRTAEQIVGETETTDEGSLDIERVLGAIRPVGVQLQRRCRKNPPDAPYEIDINLNIGATPAPDHTHNTAWISARANDPSGRTAGLTQFSLNMRWRVWYRRNGDRLWLHRFRAWFERARIRIYLTNQFRAGSCEYNDLLRHERRHDTDYRANAAEAEARVCDTAITWPSHSFPVFLSNVNQADLQKLIDDWMAFENWQLDYDNWYDGCIWDTVDYPRMYAGCPGVAVARPEAECGEAPRRPVQRGLPLPQKAL